MSGRSPSTIAATAGTRSGGRRRRGPAPGPGRRRARARVQPPRRPPRTVAAPWPAQRRSSPTARRPSRPWPVADRRTARWRPVPSGAATTVVGPFSNATAPRVAGQPLAPPSMRSSPGRAPTSASNSPSWGVSTVGRRRVEASTRRPRWRGARHRRPRPGPRCGPRPRAVAAAIRAPAVPSPGPTTIDPNRVLSSSTVRDPSSRDGISRTTTSMGAVDCRRHRGSTGGRSRTRPASPPPRPGTARRSCRAIRPRSTPRPATCASPPAGSATSRRRRRR